LTGESITCFSASGASGSALALCGKTCPQLQLKLYR
jgi:hypothetical protein